jgi:hypothetical protein
MTQGRHLEAAALKTYLEGGTDVTIPIPGQPEAYLEFQATDQHLGVRLPWDGIEPLGLEDYEHLNVAVTNIGAMNWVVLWLSGPFILDGYALLTGVADRVQIHGYAFNAAVRDAVDGLEEVLRESSRLSNDREVGLFGELTVLERLIPEIGATCAVAAWKGWLREEHDFGLEDCDLEVKTTVGERPLHWISSRDQLTPSPSRDLWLISVRLTTGGAGGRTLPEQIQAVRLLAQSETASLDAALSQAGWVSSSAAAYRRHFVLRAAPAVIPVTVNFPRIDLVSLGLLGLDASRFGEIKYQLSVEGLEVDPAPTGVLQAICREE